jgi:hypothetical protein
VITRVVSVTHIQRVVEDEKGDRFDGKKGN